MIFFCGDPHGRFDHVVLQVQARRPAAVVFLGDLQAQRPIEVELSEILGLTEVYWIPGNHDTDSESDFRHLFGSALADRNLHGRVVTIDGVRVAGLGGIFRGSIWMPPAAPVHRDYEAYRQSDPHGKRRLSKMDLCQLQSAPEKATDFQDLTRNGRWRKHQSSIFTDVYEALAAQQADILVTHEAPGAHPYGFAAIDELAKRMGVSRLFHGHHHDRFRYPPGAFQPFAVGFCGITDETGQVIVPGDFDDVRAHRNQRNDRGDRE